MKDYKILLISFVLLVFMIGAVSAADGENILTDDDPGAFIPDEEIVIGDDDEDSNVKDIYVSDTGDDSNTGSEESPYATIGKAISDVNASNIATIHIGEGTFISDDDSNFDIQLLHKIDGGSLTFIGAGVDKTFIDGQTAFRFAIFNYNTNITLKDISFINFKQGNGGAIINYGILTIENCVFKDVYSTGNQGGAIFSTASNAVLTVKNSSFISCSANGRDNYQAGGGAIRANNIASLTLVDNVFVGTSIATGSGVAIYTNSKSYINGNKFINLTGTNDASIFINDFRGSTIINNEFINCSNPSTTYSIVNLAYGSYTWNNNTFTNSSNSVGNIYATGTVSGLNLTIDDDLIDVGNDEINNGVEISVNITDDMGNIVSTNQFKVNFINENNKYTFSPSARNGKYSIRFGSMPEVGIYNVTITCAGVESEALSVADIHYSNELMELYVSPEGSDSNNGTEDSPFATIQHAIDTGFEKTFNVTVHVLEGTYSGAGNVEITIANKGTLQILGESYGESIIDGNEESWFLRISTEATLKNLKFVNGYGDGLLTGGDKAYLIDCIMESNVGEDSPILSGFNIDNLTFINNYGTAAFSTLLNNSYFANNHNEYGSGILWSSNWLNPVLIENTKFINNTVAENGGAIYIMDGHVTIKDCYIEGNKATKDGAIFVPTQSGVITVNGTTFVNNKAEENGVFGFEMDGYESFHSPPLVFNDCKFIANSATKAGVATIKIGIFNDCSFINNSADYGGVFVLLPYDIEPEEPVYIDYDTEETLTSLELNNVIFEDNIAKINGNDLYLEQKSDFYWMDDYYYQYLPLTITFNDLNVTSLVADLTANVTGPCGAIIGAADDLTFKFNGTKIGSAKIINSVATFNYAGFEDGEYVLSGNNYLPNLENVVNDAKVIVKLENVIDHVEFWVSTEGSDENGNGSESNPFKSISYAVDEATKNCRDIVIHIGEGVYTGDLNTKLSLSSMNNLTLIGEGIDKTVIDGENTTYFATITDGKNKVVLNNLTIKNMLPSNLELIGTQYYIVSEKLNALTAPITVDEGANLYMEGVEIVNCRGGQAIIVNNGNLVINNSVFSNNGLSSNGLLSGGNVTIDNSILTSNVAAQGLLTDIAFLAINNSVIKNNFNLDQFMLSGQVSSFNGGAGLTNIIENTVISNDGDNTCLSVIGYDGTYEHLCPTFSLAGNLVVNNISMINNYRSPVPEYRVSYIDGCVIAPFGYTYGSYGKNVLARNSTFINMHCIWAVNTYGQVIFDIDGCVFNNLSKIAYSFTPGDGSQYNITNTVFINCEPVIDRYGRSDREDPNCTFENNYWGSNDKPVVTFINPGRAQSFEPDTWIVLTSEDEQTVIKNLTDGENITDYTGNAPIRTDYADNNGALDYAVVFGPVGYLFTTDDDKNVIFNESEARYPFVAADPMDYRTPSVITITGFAGDLGIVGILVDLVGNPIANATISSIVNGENVANVTTDDNGTFTVKGIKNGVLTILFNGTFDYFDTEYNMTFTNAGKTTKSFINLDTIESDLAVKGTLVDDEGNPIANAVITYTLNGENSTNVTSDENGVFQVQAAPNAIVDIVFAGNDGADAVNASITMKDLAPTSVRVGTQFNVTSGFALDVYAVDYKAGERGAYFNALLTDANGNAITGALVQFGINGYVHNKTTDNVSGVASLQINLQKANDYTCAFVFLGNETHNATFVSAMIHVNKKPITISAAAKSYKATAKTKKYTVTLKTIKGSSADGKTYLKSGKKVTMKLNGKTYTAKINAKGQATFSIKLTKKGKYTAKVSFAGDDTYNAANKSVKITIK